MKTTLEVQWQSGGNLGQASSEVCQELSISNINMLQIGRRMNERFKQATHSQMGAEKLQRYWADQALLPSYRLFTCFCHSSRCHYCCPHTWAPRMKGKAKASAVSFYAEGFLKEGPFFSFYLMRLSEYLWFPRGHGDVSAMLSGWVATHLHKWAVIYYQPQQWCARICISMYEYFLFPRIDIRTSLLKMRTVRLRAV